MKIKRLLAVLLSFVMVITSAGVAFAANGPNRYYAYIYIYNDSTEVYLLDNYTGATVGKINGATYDKNTNTLSLNNFNQPTLSIETNTMGDDFKVNLTGENHIQSLRVWGDGHGGCCEFTGTGKLFINENKKAANGIYIVPEDAKAILKASGSTTITSYSNANGNSLYVNCTEDTNCIDCNMSVTPTVENFSYAKTVPVVTGVDSYARTWDVYTMEGSTNIFAVKTMPWFGSTRIDIYQIVENPEADGYILCPYFSDEGDFDPSNYNLTLTDETVQANTISYSSAETLWKDSKGNKYVFMYEWDSETSSKYYKKYSAIEFVKAERAYDGEVQWYKTVETDDTTKYADSYSAPAAAGYVYEKRYVDGLYNISVPAAPITLTPKKLAFADLKGYESYSTYIEYTSVNNSFIKGTNPPAYTEFSPTTAITRAMFVTILYRMAGAPYDNANPHKTSPFTDITNTSVYYYDAACWALDNGITTQKTFKPNDLVVREQTASFLFRYASNEGFVDDSYTSVNLKKYSDYSSVSSWAVPAMQWANQQGMITGTQQGTLNPKGSTLRIHATKILYGFGMACGIGSEFQG